MKNILVLLIIIIISCNPSKTQMKVQSSPIQFFVGTYTNAESEGIYTYQLNTDGVLEKLGLAASSDNPSFLAKSYDGKYLLVVNETNHNNQGGTIESFLIQGDSLQFLSKSPSGGAHPCFITSNDLGYVLVANYSGGNIGLLKHDDKGILSDLLDVQQHSGKGTTARQEAPHAHSCWFEPSGSDVISVDLGTNELWISKLDTKAQKFAPDDPMKLAMAEGAGPRHLTFHPNGTWIYIVNELDGTITMVERSASGIYVTKTTVSTLPPDYTEANTCADIHISSDGKFVYASNRGHNSIAIFEVDLEVGSLRLVGHESTRGDGPRNFVLSPDENFLLVANQLTNNIVSFKRNLETGTLDFVNEIGAPTPVCLLF